ncbi:AsmA family protein [Lacisediminimonas sp.]|uniref:AsmA family protein n=1 Tax=Lacisediminimonas sp. TaxID=3060582 RepID=UPI00271DC729|nr:AsmA family protein [Lacisediminimonas sp.]MDO8299914.1 AsmA family protein [Lacisediminimonas sp.]
MRPRTIAIAAALVIVSVPAIALVVLHNFDWNRARPWLNSRASEAIGRPFAVAGDLTVTWSRVAGKPGEGWRNMVPWPRLLAKDIHIGNPSTPTAGPIAATDMAAVRELSFSLNPFALMQKKISIPLLSFDTPSVNLVRTANGANNWTFPASEKPQPWRIAINTISFSKGSIHLADAVNRADLTMTIDTLDTDPVYGLAWKLSGRFNGEVASGEGKAGGVLSLQNQVEPFPLMADLHFGKTAIALVGTLTKPSSLAALDLRVKFSGVSMARLEPLTGVVLPETPPFATEGHLVATLGAGGSHWTYKNFQGRVGASDISGMLGYQTAKPRARLSGVVVSKQLLFSDLAPLIGADSNASKLKRGAPAVQPANKVFPVEPFATQRWTGIDADIQFSAEKIVRSKNLPIDKLSTNVHLKDGVLRLSPLNFNVAGGSITSDIKLDSGGGVGKNAIKGEIKATARGLRVKQLFPSVELLKESAGEINGDASLSAVGNSVASLMAASNGEFKTFISKGTVSKLLLEKMGLNLGSVVLATFTGDHQVKLNCMATDFAVTQGMMHARSFIIDTEAALLDVTGDINLAQEQLDLTIKPGSKGMRLFSLRAPLYVKGSFKDPQVSVDKGVMALKAGGAIALAVLAPVTAVLPLINTGRRDESSDCERLLAAARVKSVAPPPGKLARVSTERRSVATKPAAVGGAKQ